MLLFTGLADAWYVSSVFICLLFRNSHLLLQFSEVWRIMNQWLELAPLVFEDSWNENIKDGLIFNYTRNMYLKMLLFDIHSASKLSHPIFCLPNFNLTLTLHQFLSFRLSFLILISTDWKFSFAFDSFYRIKISYTTFKIQQKDWQEAVLEKNKKLR